MKKIYKFVIGLIIFLSVSNFTYKVYASTPINPINEVYKEGIYQLNKYDNGSYDLKFQFLDKDSKSAIIVLNQNADIVYKNINCNRLCNAGNITNQNIIIIITEGEVALNFSKTQ